VVIGHDPWRARRLHPDHERAGRLTIESIVAARDPHFFPEQDLVPHRPATVLLFEPAIVDHVERVDTHVDAKIAALLAHRSQWRSTMGIDAESEGQLRDFEQRIRDEARTAGTRAGVRAAEAFARIDHL
jgi:LmbE family N-acetylglucosaminyl deacetylase